MEARILIALAAATLLTSCATRPHVYAPPNPSKLKASTTRVSVAVDRAHVHAREAKTKVDEASQIAKEVGEETRALQNVPVTLLQRQNDLERKLDESSLAQAALEKDLVEATLAKAQVEKDKTDYFAAAQKLADSASEERVQRVSVEKKLSWYRWHWFGSWIVLGLGVLAIIVLAFLKFTGRLAIAGLKL